MSSGFDLNMQANLNAFKAKFDAAAKALDAAILERGLPPITSSVRYRRVRLRRPLGRLYRNGMTPTLHPDMEEAAVFSMF